MRVRLLLWLCLGLNVLLALTIVWLSRNARNGGPGPTANVATAEGATQFKTNVVVRRYGFHWREVESADFPTYIANLRRIGCPERTIRDIIVAEVNELFADRMVREIQLPEQKWWLPEPDGDALEAVMEQVRAFEMEKAQLLTTLLGPAWEGQRLSGTASVVRFDGPVLSKLPPETKSAVARIEAAARRARAEAVQRASEEGRAMDPAELTRLRQEKRRELAALLGPEQLEEYLLRYSDTAEQMRAELRGFGTDAEEFRRIFRARDGFEQQIAALDTNNPAGASRRAELERLRDESIRQVIGPERFAFYQMSQNPLFRQAQAQAEQNGAPPEKVIPIFRVNQEAQAEIARIQADQTITEDQRRVALAVVQQQQQNSIDRILGSQPADDVQAQVQTPAPIGNGVQAQPNQPIIEPPPFPPLPPETFGAPARTRGPAFPPNRRQSR